MDPIAELHARGGVTRTRTLLRAGVSAHALRRAKESGGIRTVRNGWVALPDADRMKVAAAKRGVIISCITVADRCGLWVPDASEVHVAAPAHAGRVNAGTSFVHWARPALPRHPDDCEDSLENALVLIASCQPFESALVVWESALNKRLVDLDVLRHLPLPPPAVRVLEHARPFSDSGLETIVPQRLRWMNVPMQQQVWLLGRPVDLLIGDRLVLQIDGGHHVGAQRTSDIEHDAQLKLRGFHVIRVGYDQVMNQWPSVQALIMDAVAQRLHLA